MSEHAVEMEPGSTLERFTQGVQASMERATTLSELLRQLSTQMREALRDPQFLPGERWSYTDPHQLFQIHAGPSAPGNDTGPHDHGEHWVVYGVRRGALETTRYERLDDGSDADYAELRSVNQFVLGPGDVDAIEPWGIHNQKNATDQTAFDFVLRGNPNPTYLRNKFDLETRRVTRIGGPAA
ncbi:MAG: hypothetical protein EXR58_08335 [Chloroflexi bacterium]|nr:hypothetical protein [Chloroflexota bacterium]